MVWLVRSYLALQTVEWVDKAVAKHFADTNSREEDLVFVPFKKIRSSNILVLRHLETEFINKFNLVEAGINRILS